MYFPEKYRETQTSENKQWQAKTGEDPRKCKQKKPTKYGKLNEQTLLKIVT